MPERIRTGDDSGTARKWLLSLILLAAYILVVGRFFAPVQLRIWNSFGALDLGIMVVLIGPFLAARWLLDARARATRWTWWLGALMAVDFLAFAVSTFLPTGGHPSLEALVSYFVGYIKVVCLPLALAGLVAAAFQGERSFLLLLGLACLVGETLYTVCGPDHPFHWLLASRSGGP